MKMPTLLPQTWQYGAWIVRVVAVQAPAKVYWILGDKPLRTGRARAQKSVDLAYETGGRPLRAEGPDGLDDALGPAGGGGR